MCVCIHSVQLSLHFSDLQSYSVNFVHCFSGEEAERLVVFVKTLATRQNGMFLNFRHLQIEMQNHRVSLAKVNSLYMSFLLIPNTHKPFSLATHRQ